MKTNLCSIFKEIISGKPLQENPLKIANCDNHNSYTKFFADTVRKTFSLVYIGGMCLNLPLQNVGRKGEGSDVGHRVLHNPHVVLLQTGCCRRVYSLRVHFDSTKQIQKISNAHFTVNEILSIILFSQLFIDTHNLIQIFLSNKTVLIEFIKLYFNRAKYDCSLRLYQPNKALIIQTKQCSDMYYM